MFYYLYVGDYMKEKLKLYIENNLVIEETLFESVSLCSEYDYLEDVPVRATYKRCKSSSINDYINENKSKYNDFQTMLFRFIDEKNLKDSDVYNKVHIDRRLFSKIRSDSNYHPSKETIILLGLSLELNEDEIDKLLESASYSLPKNNHYDLIIRFCFINKIYKLTDVNDLLDEYNCKMFSY